MSTCVMDSHINGGNSWWLINSLAPGGFENIFQNVFFKLISWIDTLSNSCETALRSMPQNPSDDKSTLVQVMAWCRQAASHYLSQCCPRSLSPYGVTRPQWVKWISFRVTGPVWWETTGHRWIPLTKASDAEIWCFLWSAPEQTVEPTIRTLVIWDAIALNKMSA